MKASVLASALAVVVLGGTTALVSQTVPNAPAPQANTKTPAGIFSGVTPGEGTTADSNNDNMNAPIPPEPPAAAPAAADDSDDQTPPELPPLGEGPSAFHFNVQTTFVEVPVTVKDSKGSLVPGLTWRNFRVLENGQPQRIVLFTVDPFPISAAMVIDQSLTRDTMEKVNKSLAALQGAFTPSDEMAVFTYNNGPEEKTEFTGAQSARVEVVLQTLQTKGRDMGVPVNSGPTSGGISINGKPDFENNPTMHPHNNGAFITIPKETHTLNDAILAAAEAVAKRPGGRRRIVYVISDGKEYGSKASFKEVEQYLLTNKISVYATLVGDSSYLGPVSRIHIPFTMRDNILPKYAFATGGEVDSEFRQNSIETDFARIAEQVRLQYTLGYNSHIPSLNPAFRPIEVKVNRPALTVIAPAGYYPTAEPIHTTAPAPKKHP